MKVLFISEHPHTNIGGIENDIRHIGETLKLQGMEVDYINAKEFTGVSVFDKNIVLKKEINKRILESDPNIIHIFGFSSFFLYQCLVLSKKTLSHVKLIYTPCYHPFSQHSHPTLAFLFFHLFLKKGFKNVDALIALSPNEKDFFVQYLNAAKINIVPNGMAIDPNISGREKPLEHTLLFVGRNDHNKRLDFLENQREYFKYKGIKCHIVTNEVKVSDDIFIYNKDLSSAQLGKLYEKCTLLAVPSKYEAFSIVALEAMSYGMPVLISDHVQIKSYLGDDEEFNKVFHYGDSEDFQNKLDLILKIDPSAYSEFSRQNIQFSKAFEWQNIIEKLLVFYSGNK